MVVLLGIGLLAGFLTAVSPCVLPVLPLVLVGGASAGSDRRRPYAIVLGLIVSFSVFTLAGTWLLQLAGLPLDTLQNIAIAVLFLLAATLLVPRFGAIVERPFLWLQRRLLPLTGKSLDPIARARGESPRSGLLLGLSLGVVFVPCAGPVLTTIVALSAAHQIGFGTVLLTVAFAVGAAVPLLFIALSGQRAVSRVGFLRRHTLAVRRGSGIVLAGIAVALILGLDATIATRLPNYTAGAQGAIEDNAVARKQLDKLRSASGGEALAAAAPRVRATTDPLAPEFRGLTNWLNTPDGHPITLASLRGKVVLVDFWTYSCINCLRTLPHLKAWDAAYRSKGFVIVGVHTPEFAFERVPSNVRSATRRLGVRYPVGLDNGFKTWNAYANRYWPAEYLIDRTGHVRRTHFGEGEYSETEAMIRKLLAEQRVSLPRRATAIADQTPTAIATPESYLGYERLARYAGSPIVPDRQSSYVLPPRLGPDELAYGGKWRVGGDRIIAGSGARIRLHFQAQHVYLVLAGHGRVAVSLDGRTRPGIDVDGSRLYTIFNLPHSREGLLELRLAPGLAGYAFTFG